MAYSKVAAMSDIHGDIVRMGELLNEGGLTDKEGNWRVENTLMVFDGDFVDRGKNGVAVMKEVIRLTKIAPESCGVATIMGNHDAAMLAVALYLRGDGKLMQNDFDIFHHNGGSMEEAIQIASDDELVEFLKNLKMIHVEGDYLFQHIDGIQFYRSLGAEKDGENAHSINATGRLMVETTLGAWSMFNHMTDDRRFQGTSRDGLRKYLNFFNAKCVVHGHTYTSKQEAEVWMGGMAINIDGRMSSAYQTKPKRGIFWSADPKISEPVTQLVQ